MTDGGRGGCLSCGELLLGTLRQGLPSLPGHPKHLCLCVREVEEGP